MVQSELPLSVASVLHMENITNLVRDKTNYKDPKKVKRLIKKLER